MASEKEIEAGANALLEFEDFIRSTARDMAKAALEAAERVRWQPPDSAPKDGNEFLAEICGNTYAVVCFDEYNTKWQTADGIGYHRDAITRWQYLPLPPEDK